MPNRSMSYARMKRAKKAIQKKKAAGSGYKASGKARILYPGVAATARRNFGTKSVKTESTFKKTVAAMVRALDAKLPRTIGLPRAVGPYTVIRTNTLVSTSDHSNVIIFTPMAMPNTAGDSAGADGLKWMASVGIAQKGADNTQIGAAGGIELLTSPLASMGDFASVVPASMTVQVVNAKPLESAAGSFFMGRANQPLNFGGSTEHWSTFRSNFISYFSPRMLAGGKLALRGVQCSAYPLDMTDYSDFRKIERTVATQWHTAYNTGPLTPIVFVSNQQSVADSVQFLVTMEWRVRFDPENPAVASHKHHDTTSDEVWNEVCKVASSTAHGVEEMTEDIAAGGALGAGIGLGIAML